MVEALAVNQLTKQPLLRHSLNSAAAALSIPFVPDNGRQIAGKWHNMIGK